MKEADKSKMNEKKCMIAGSYFARNIERMLDKEIEKTGIIYVYADEGDTPGIFIDRFTDELEKTVESMTENAEYLILELHDLLGTLCCCKDNYIINEKRLFEKLITIINQRFRNKTIIIGSLRPDSYIDDKGLIFKVPEDFRITKDKAAIQRRMEEYLRKSVHGIIVDPTDSYLYVKRNGYFLNEHNFEKRCYKETAKTVSAVILNGSKLAKRVNTNVAGVKKRNSESNILKPEQILNDIEEPSFGRPLQYCNAIPEALQPYNAEEAHDTIIKVNTLIDDDALCFICVTDIHYKSCKKANKYPFDMTFERMFANMREVAKEIPCEFIMNLGDDTDGRFNRIGELLEIEDYMNNRMLDLGKPYYRAIGNHDTNVYASLIDIRTMYRAYCSHIPFYPGINYNPDSEGTEYYKDFGKYGIRLIVLNTMYGDLFRFSESTGKWLKTDALNTDKLILLCEHLSPVHTMNMNAKPLENREEVIDALKGVKDRLIQICGHSHCDYSFTDGDDDYSPWLTVFSNLQRCSKRRQRDIGDVTVGHTDGVFGCPKRTAWTVSEDCWDVVVLRPAAGKINFVRFGAGEDREFTFKPVMK